MKKLLFIITSLLITNIYSQNISKTVTKEYIEELKKSIYDEIIEVRKNPKKNSYKYDYDISEFEPSKNVCKYDVKLCKESQEYADYLYNKSKGKGSNFELIHSPSYVICNESLAWIDNPLNVVKQFIEEINYDGDGHRLHVMNVKPTHKNDTKIGIGVVYDPITQMYFIVFRSK